MRGDGSPLGVPYPPVGRAPRGRGAAAARPPPWRRPSRRTPTGTAAGGEGRGWRGGEGTGSGHTVRSRTDLGTGPEGGITPRHPPRFQARPFCLFGLITASGMRDSESPHTDPTRFVGRVPPSNQPQGGRYLDGLGRQEVVVGLGEEAAELLRLHVPPVRRLRLEGVPTPAPLLGSPPPPPSIPLPSSWLSTQRSRTEVDKESQGQEAGQTGGR